MTWSIDNADALEWLAGLPDGAADVFVFDPPFTSAGGSTNGRSAGRNADAQFFLHWFSSVMSEVKRVTKPGGCGFVHCDWRTLPVVQDAVWGRSVRQTSAGWEMTQPIVWDRGSIGLGSPFRNQWEMVAFVRGPEWQRGDLPKNLPNIVRHRWPYGQHHNHPAEKPVDLARDLVCWATWGCSSAVVLDPFAGSGTVGVACAMEGRGYLGCEIDEDAHSAAMARVGAAMLDGPAPTPQRPQLSLIGAP